MAAFNFPNSPNTNDLHTENNVTWKWNGTVWKRINNSYLTASTLNISGIGTFIGNVKIGSTGAPALAVGGGLEIDRAGAATIRIEDSSSSSSFEIQNTGGVIKQRLLNNQPWIVEHGTGEKLRIANDGDVTITSADAGATGPTLKLFHNSASPADNDIISVISMSGDDDGGNETEYAAIKTKVTDVSGGVEQSHLSFYTRGLSSWNEIFRLNNRSTASSPSYTTDDINGIILDVYNTGNPYPRYMSFIAKSAGDTDSNIDFWTESVGGSPTRKLRITAGGILTWTSGSTVMSGTGNSYSLNIYRDSGSGYAYLDCLTNSTSHTGWQIRAYHNGTYNKVLAHNTSDYTWFETGGTERLRITSGGYVNIGGNYTQTTDTLQVDGNIRGNNLKASASIYADANANVSLQLHSTGTTGTSRIFFGDASTFQAGKIIYDHNGDYMQFGTGGNGAEVMRITADKKVGINRTSPTAPLTARRTDAGGSNAAGVIAEFANSSGYGVWFGQSSASGASWGSTTGDFYWCTSGLSSQRERLRLRSDGHVIIDTTLNGYGGLKIYDDSSGDYHVRYIAGRNQGATAHVFMRSGRTQNQTPWADATPVEHARIHRGGISFGGDTAEVNTLDDYEEGTWTPVYVSSNATFGYSLQEGWYIKVGKLVTVRAYIATSSVSSTSHSLLKMSGLPFQVAYRTPCSVRAWNFQGSGYDQFPTVATFEHNQTYLEFLKYTSGGTSDYTTSTMNNSSYIVIAGSYKID